MFSVALTASAGFEAFVPPFALVLLMGMGLTLWHLRRLARTRRVLREHGLSAYGRRYRGVWKDVPVSVVLEDGQILVEATIRGLDERTTVQRWSRAHLDPFSTDPFGETFRVGIGDPTMVGILGTSVRARIASGVAEHIREGRLRSALPLDELKALGIHLDAFVSLVRALEVALEDRPQSLTRMMVEDDPKTRRRAIETYTLYFGHGHAAVVDTVIREGSAAAIADLGVAWRDRAVLERALSHPRLPADARFEVDAVLTELPATAIYRNEGEDVQRGSRP